MAIRINPDRACGCKQKPPEIVDILFFNILIVIRRPTRLKILKLFFDGSREKLPLVTKLQNSFAHEMLNKIEKPFLGKTQIPFKWRIFP